MLEFGTVTRFFEEPRLFGFVRLATGEELFFHRNEHRNVTVDARGEHQFNFGMRPYPPSFGDVIYFTRRPGKDGKPKASPWCFEVQYEYALEQWAHLPRFRVMAQVIADGKSRAPMKLWEGCDVDELSAKYPRHADATRDRLQSTISGRIHTHISFEQMLDDGSAWGTGYDPRPKEGTAFQLLGSEQAQHYVETQVLSKLRQVWW